MTVYININSNTKFWNFKTQNQTFEFEIFLKHHKIWSLNANFRVLISTSDNNLEISSSNTKFQVWKRNFIFKHDVWGKLKTKLWDYISMKLLIKKQNFKLKHEVPILISKFQDK